MQSNWTKKQVLAWFGDRGVPLEASGLKKWFWKEGKLFFVIEDGGMHFADTEEGMVDVTQTHRDDGSAILVYEPDDSIPLEKSPLAE